MEKKLVVTDKIDEPETIESTVIYINIDELGIDICNIRGGKWDGDEEFIESIKKWGILVPLLIRPAVKETGVKYAIISGSRRYHGGIEADLQELPCIVKEVNDIDAVALSIIENKHRTDIPVWRYASTVGFIYDQLDETKSKPDRVKIIKEKTGLSESSIGRYLDLISMSEEEFALLKKPEERNEEDIRILEKFNMADAKALTETKALFIVKAAEKLTDQGITVSKQKRMELVEAVIGIQSETYAKELVDIFMTFPKETMRQIKERYYSIPKGKTWNVPVDASLDALIIDACKKKDMSRPKLVVYYVKDGLKRDGFYI